MEIVEPMFKTIIPVCKSDLLKIIKHQCVTEIRSAESLVAITLKRQSMVNFNSRRISTLIQQSTAMAKAVRMEQASVME